MKILQNNLAKASTYLWGSMFGRGCSSGSDVVRLGGGFSSGELGWDDPGRLFKSCDMKRFNGDSGRGLLLMAAKSLWNLGRARHGFVLQHLSWGNTDSDPNRRHTAAGGWRSWCAGEDWDGYREGNKSRAAVAPERNGRAAAALPYALRSPCSCVL